MAIINKDVLEKEFFQNSALAYEFMKWMSDYFRKTKRNFVILSLMEKKVRCIQQLIRMTNSYGVQKTMGF